MQPQPLSTTQLIDLSQLHNHRHNQPQPNPNVVSTGLRLSFGDQQQQNHQYQQQNFGTGACQSSVLLSLSSEDFSTQVKRQRDEIDQFLQAQVPKFSPRPGPIFFLSQGCAKMDEKISLYAGRAAEAHISREKTAALPCTIRSRGGIDSQEIEGKGNGS